MDKELKYLALVLIFGMMCFVLVITTTEWGKNWNYDGYVELPIESAMDLEREINKISGSDDSAGVITYTPDEDTAYVNYNFRSDYSLVDKYSLDATFDVGNNVFQWVGVGIVIFGVCGFIFVATAPVKDSW